MILRRPGSRINAASFMERRPCHSNLHNCLVVFRRALFSLHDFLLFIFFQMGKGEDVERKGFDINSFQGDPSWGWEGFLLPSVHTEEGGVCAQTQGITGGFSLESWFLPAGTSRCCSVLRLMGTDARRAWAEILRGLWGTQEHFQSSWAPPALCRGWTGPDFLAAGSLPSFRRAL